MKKLTLPISLLAFTSMMLLFTQCGNSTTEQRNFATGTSGPYSKDAVIFSLSLISNINEGRFGTVDELQAQATKGINNLLQNDSVEALIGTWTPVWGPVTYTNDTSSNPDSCVSDNTMMLLKGTDPSDASKTMYVLAIAGTIGASSFDWFSEDFNLTSMALWPQKTIGKSNVMAFNAPSASTSPTVTDTGRYISNGLAIGLNILFNEMVDGTNGKILQYLHATFGNTNAPIEIAVAGHSLGGALSPCVALSLADNQSFWNPSNANVVTCYATAGFSPGNAKFAAYFNQQLGEQFLGACNSNDIAINLYQTSTMSQIPNLYNNVLGNCTYLQNQSFIASLINCFSGKVAPFGYTSIYAPTDSFTAAVNDDCGTFSIIYGLAEKAYNKPSATEQGLITVYQNAAKNFNLPATDSSFAQTVCFGEMVMQQHVDAYINHFGVGQLQQYYNQQLAIPIPNPSTVTLGMKIGAFTNPIFHSCLDL